MGLKLVPRSWLTIHNQGTITFDGVNLVGNILTKVSTDDDAKVVE